MSKLILLPLMILLPAISYTQSELFPEYKWKNRLVILLYDTEDNIEFKSQNIIIKRNEDGYLERDIKVLSFKHHDPIAVRLRAENSLPSKGFVFVLIGKDGYPKLIKERRVMPKALFALIDAMPMRRAEIEKRKGN